MRKQVILLSFLWCFLSAGLGYAEEQPARSRLFPLLGDKVPEQFKDQLPLPLGVSATYVYASEHLDVSDWSLRINGRSISPDLIKANKLKQETEVGSVRLDAWVLPFLNVYGVVGGVKGKWMDIVLGLAGEPVPTRIKSSFDGATFGGGVTMAAGYKFFFVTCDANYTFTDVSILSSGVETIMITPRSGIRVPVFHKKMHLSVYGGAGKEDIVNRLKGTITTAGGTQLDFALDASARSPWTPLVGTLLEYGKHWGLILEGSFGDRKMVVCSLNARW